MQEGMAINQSLTCLGQVITALVEHRKPSFRDTALTHVLKDSLVGNCKTTILVCLSPHRFNVMETINTLRFAQRAKMIKNKFKVNKTRSAKELLRELKSKDEEIRLLETTATASSDEICFIRTSTTRNSLHSFSIHRQERKKEKVTELRRPLV
eukprot:TRINITY_DN1536_c0_g1_i1.p2 TRINITY_DN1536_c0_g1~~TRINITY_DN1536_c0_g1_i1.p2  ORF type:complete len:153 (+),score=24.39 TRINITY_DN1536_c0_g1_i1:122-580(+)